MIKIDIVSGFLGAGKTTLIKKLLKEALADTKVVLIENEFGEIGIDGGFLKESGIEIKEMNSGCICCSLVGDFGASLKEVLTIYTPERVLIEPSGVGKLSDVLKAVEDVAKDLDVKVSSAVVVVDVSKCKMYMKNFGEFFLNQVEYAGTIILSRTDKLSAEKVSDCVAILREHNDKAAIITTSWDQLDGEDVLKAMEGSGGLDEMLKEMLEHAQEEHHHDHDHGESCTCGCHNHHHEGHDHKCHHHEEHNHDHDHDHDHDDHHADEIFASWGMETPNAYSREEIGDILTALDSGDYGVVLRAKGMVPDQDETWIYFDHVPAEHDIRDGKPDITGKFCVIGAELKEDKLVELFRK